MTQLYSTLANVYHQMYQRIFDYDKEFKFYDSILKENNCNKILEIACGSGILGGKFIQAGYDYLGLDLFREMIEIAKSETKSDKFIQGDMRKLDLEQEFDAILITGRSLAYVTENLEIMSTLNGIHQALKENGLLIFGVFEANGIFDNFNDFEQEIEFEGKIIKRFSTLKKNLKSGFTYDWQATYSFPVDNDLKEFKDLTTLRAFTKDEMTLFLKLAGFLIVKLIDENKTFSIIAQNT